jgi:CTP synthase
MPIGSAERRKISLFAGVKPEMVVNLPDIKNVYEMPQNLFNMKFHHLIAEKLDLQINDSFNWDIPTSFLPLKIGMVGKYLGTDDAYKSINESIFLSGAEKPEILDAQEIEDLSDAEVENLLSQYDALIIPGGFGKRGIEGKLKAIKYARENKVPILGICLGMQLMVIEFARNCMGISEANSTEFDPDTAYPVIDMMAEQKEILRLGGTMRLGAQKTPVFDGTKLKEVYGGKTEVIERHRHRYEVNYELCKEFFDREECGFKVSSKADFVEAVEIKDHPFFVGIQYHPEYGTKVGAPHPLFVKLIKAAQEKK